MSLAFLVFLVVWLFGMVATFIPVLPATLIIFLATVAATFIDGFQVWPDLPFLIGVGIVTFMVSLVDNVASAWGARRYGGSKQAGWGALIGGFVGIFLGPLGIIVGPLGGAFVAELAFARRPPGEAARSAWGTLIGLLAGIAAKFFLHLVIGVVELFRLWNPEKAFF